MDITEGFSSGDAGYVLVPPVRTNNGTGGATGGLEVLSHGEIWTPAVIQRVATLAFLMIVSLFGNVVIIVVLSCSRYRKLSNRVNIFIVHLAVGDLTVCCVTMTTEVVFVVFEEAWVLGYVACKVLLYAQMVTLASTTFILTAMSFDRYLAICRPLSLGASSSASRAKTMVSVSWVAAFVFASPQLVIFTQRAEGVYPDGQIKYACKSIGYTAWWQRKTYFTFLTLYILVIPAIVISYCYINVVRVVWKQGKEVSNKEGVALRRTVKDARFLNRAKVKTIKMTLSIICSFIACWTPYFVVHLIHIWTEYRFKFEQSVLVFAETVALFNSAINPLLYGVFNVQLKRGLAEICCWGSSYDGVRRRRRTRSLRSESWTTTNGRCRGASQSALAFVALGGGGGHGGDQRKRSSSESSNAAAAAAAGAQGSSEDRKKIVKEENKLGFKLRVRFVNMGTTRLNDVSSNGASPIMTSDAENSCGRNKDGETSRV